MNRAKEILLEELKMWPDDIKRHEGAIANIEKAVERVAIYFANYLQENYDMNYDDEANWGWNKPNDFSEIFSTEELFKLFNSGVIASQETNEED